MWPSFQIFQYVAILTMFAATDYDCCVWFKHKDLSLVWY